MSCARTCHAISPWVLATCCTKSSQRRSPRRSALRHARSAASGATMRPVNRGSWKSIARDSARRAGGCAGMGGRSREPMTEDLSDRHGKKAHNLVSVSVEGGDSRCASTSEDQGLPDGHPTKRHARMPGKPNVSDARSNRALKICRASEVPTRTDAGTPEQPLVVQLVQLQQALGDHLLLVSAGWMREVREGSQSHGPQGRPPRGKMLVAFPFRGGFRRPHW